MKKVFLSHSSKDKPFVRKLATDLEKYGLSVWLDERNIKIGDSIFDSVEQGILDSDFAIIIISNETFERPWVKRELKALFDLEIERGEKIIIPALIEETTLPLFLRDKKYTKFFEGYDLALKEILEAMTGHLKNDTYEFTVIKGLANIDIKDSSGNEISIEKSMLIKTTKEIEKCIDILSADGEIANVVVRPSIINKQWEESGLLYVESTFPTKIMAGIELEREVNFLMLNSFSKNEEYFEARHYHPTSESELNILFPFDRPPINYELFEKRGMDRISMPERIFKSVIEDRVRIQILIENPKLLSSYVVKWNW
jgi:hypothetical protein